MGLNDPGWAKSFRLLSLILVCGIDMVDPLLSERKIHNDRFLTGVQINSQA